MEPWTAFQRLTLLCLLTAASLLYLIENVAGAPPTSPPLLLLEEEGKSSEELVQPGTPLSLSSLSPSVVGENKTSSSVTESDREERGRLFSFTMPPIQYKKKTRRRTQIQRRKGSSADESTMKTTATAGSVKKDPATPATIEKMEDLEYAFENGTDITRVGNKTVTSADNVDPPIEVEDNFCPRALTPAAGESRVVLQSTLPALILLVNIGVHFVAFVMMLYLWKTVYYEVGDPYATVSPYGYGPGRRRRQQRYDNVEALLLPTASHVTSSIKRVQRAVEKYNKV